VAASDVTILADSYRERAHAHGTVSMLALP
jgi:hypothetical protein